jgi:hypothetical protein
MLSVARLPADAFAAARLFAALTLVR